MPNTKSAAFGIYSNRNDVELAVELLRSNDFSKREISILLPHPEHIHPHVTDTKSTEGAEIGAGVGALVGSILGTLAGVGMLAVPGVGTLILFGPFTTMLISTVAAAGVGGLWGGLLGLGIPEKEAEHFQNRLHKGDTLLSVHVGDPDRIIRAKEIMVGTNAQDVYSRAPLVCSGSVNK